MEVNEVALKVMSAKAGLPMQFTYKEIKLFEVLAKILEKNKNSNLELVLKGGTALNKIYLKENQRFSEDIDFDLFSPREKLREVILIDGFKTNGPWRFRNTLRYELEYESIGKKDHVRVEFRIGNKLKTLNSIKSENMTSLVTGTSLYGIPVYSLEDLVARKMNALRSRTEGKDIWDCYFAIPKCKNLKLAIKLALESEDLEMTVEKSLESTISKLKKVDSKSIMRLTNQYIPFSERPKSWQQTIDELIITIENLQANF